MTEPPMTRDKKGLLEALQAVFTERDELKAQVNALLGSKRLPSKPVEGCKHEKEDGEPTIFVDKLQFNPITGHEVSVHCTLCKQNGFISIGDLPVEWESSAGKDDGPRADGGNAGSSGSYVGHS
jgi:hypothetical protein